ncbi:MAG: hypothetical protein AB7G11_12055 [Phycisphaerales bacterium]
MPRLYSPSPSLRQSRLRAALLCAAAAAGSALLGALAACASSPDTQGPPAFRADDPPADFTLAVTVYSGPGARRRAEYPADRLPARYIIEPDGTLHAWASPAASDQSYPGQVRRLSLEQVRRLWRQLQASGLLRDDHPASVGHVGPFLDPSLLDFEDVITAPPRYSVFFAASGVRRVLALDGADADAAVPIVQTLAQQAWFAQ